MRMEFEPGYDRTWSCTYVYYYPANGVLQCSDVRFIITELSRFFHTDFPVHVSDGKSDYMTSYDSIHDFLAKAVFSDDKMIGADFLLPVQDEKYSLHIELRENRISIRYEHNDPDEKFDFNPIMQHIFQAISKTGHGEKTAFIRKVYKQTRTDHHNSVIKVSLNPTLQEKHDMLALRIFDREFHLGTIYTAVWDYEQHFWRRFEGFLQYLQEAPRDEDYACLFWVGFDLIIRGIKYRVNLNFCSLHESVTIEFDEKTEIPYDFTAVLEKLEKAMNE